MRTRHALFCAVLLSLPGLSFAEDPPASAVAGVELIDRDALFGDPERTNVQASPDGRYLSWTALAGGTMNVWVAPADDPSKAKAVTDDRSQGIRTYSWTYRANTLVYRRDTGGDENYHLYSVEVSTGAKRDLTPYPKTRALIQGVSHRHPGEIVVVMNDRDAKWNDLYKIDLVTGRRTLLAKNDAELSDYFVDPDFRLRLAQHSRKDGGIDLVKPDGKGGWTKAGDIPAADSLTTFPGGFTADGKTQYFSDSRGRDTGALYAVDVMTGRKTLVHEDPRVDVGTSILQDPKTGVVQAVQTTWLRNEWIPVGDAITADLKTLAGIGPGEFSVSTRTLDDRMWIVAYAAAETPDVYYRYDRTGGQGTLTRLFTAYPKLEGKPLVPLWPQVIKARDGLDLVSYLTLPKGADANADDKADRPVPMVLSVHGGPWARDLYGYAAEYQWLANRGYAVLSVNFRGSSGFGKKFINAADHEWAGKMHDDLIDAVQWAVKEGITTSDQVAIFGGSYGGYAALVGVTFTPDAFKCGVDYFGPSNLETLLASIPPYWAWQREQFANRAGDPRTEAGRKLLAGRSPLSRVDAIRRPLLIGQGANDACVKQAESDQIVEAMKKKNIPVTYVLFPDEGHGFRRSENLKAITAVTEGFLAQCLGGRAQPIGGDLAGSSIAVPAGAEGVPGLVDALESHKQQVKK